MTALSWILIGIIGAGLTAALIIAGKRRAISLRPGHLKVMAGDIRNYFRFEAADHRRKMAELHRLIELAPGTLLRTRGRAASPDFLLIVAHEILTRKPARVLECGAGVSTLVIAQALKQVGGGRVYSLENLESHAARVSKRLEDLGLANYGKVVVAPLISHEIHGKPQPWYDVGGLPDQNWDLIIVDGPPAAIGEAARYPVGPIMLPRLSACGRVLVDDTHRPHDRAICDRLSAEFGLTCSDRPAEKGCCVLRHAPSAPEPEPEPEDNMTEVMPAE